MASLQTWSSASHFRHPWFDAAVTKRKHPSPRLPYDMDDDEDEDPNAPPTKRRRCTTLENGLAHLSLSSNSTLPRSGGSHVPIVEEVLTSSSASEVNPPPKQYFPSPDTPLAGVVLPSSIEEPSVPEVTMKPSTWYEPEPDRIIITDLDGFVEEDEVDSQHDERTPTGIEVHPTYLEQIRTGRRKHESLPSSDVSSSQALILFRPPPPLLAPHQTRAPASTAIDSSLSTNTPDEDAMDLDS